MNNSVTVYLEEKRGIYQAVIQYVENNKRKFKRKSTGIKAIKGQKKTLRKLAEERAEIIKNEFEKKINEQNKKVLSNNVNYNKEILFCDYMVEWLDSISNVKAKTTIGGYESNIKGIIYPYFEEKRLLLTNLTTIDIQNFYDTQYKLGKSARTIKHYHNNIHQVLEKARKMKLISNNPSDDCCLQKPKQYIPQIYSAKELNDFMKKIIGNEIEIPVIIASYYGFRREEVIGLKWNRIDFDNNTITIAHVVTATTINHKKVIDKKDIPKNSTSYRTLPLINAVKEYLQKVKEKQEKNKNLFKNSYKNNEGYVCVNEEGNLINPDTLTKKFAKFLKDNELRKIRFHDLRHSIGSLLISKASTRQVQE